MGPYGTITDSLAPRDSSPPRSAAGLLYHRRTGKGVYLDISQVESANWSLSPWLLDYEVDGVLRLRDGNRHAHMAPHGAFRCADESGIARPLGRDRVPHRRRLARARVDHRRRRVDGSPRSPSGKLHEDEVEALVTAWTRTRTRAEVAQTLQANGIEAVPVEDFADLHDDPQLALRKHFEPHTHAFLGPGLYERNGFRMSDAPAGYDQAGPTLGQDSDWVLRDLLGMHRRGDRAQLKGRHRRPLGTESNRHDGSRWTSDRSPPPIASGSPTSSSPHFGSVRDRVARRADRGRVAARRLRGGARRAAGRLRAAQRRRRPRPSCVVLATNYRGAGAGTQLLEAVVARAKEAGWSRLWLDHEQRQHRRDPPVPARGMGLGRLPPRRHHAGTRPLKPEIPETGNHGIPLRHEIEFEYPL